jgi:hypothetical protein
VVVDGHLPFERSVELAPGESHTLAVVPLEASGR